MDDLHDRLAAGDNSEKYDIPVVTAPVDLGLPMAAAPDLVEKPAPITPAPLTPAEALVNPDILAQVKARVADFNVTAADWLKLEVIESSSQSGQLTDFVTGASKVKKVIDALRGEAKRPHMDAASKIEALFKGFEATVQKIIDRVTPIQQVWLDKEKIRLNAEKAALALAAKAAAEKAAADLAAAKAANDIQAEVAAEAAAKEAGKLEKVAARPVVVSARSASGAGRTMAERRTISVSLVNQRLAIAEFSASPELAACLVSLAQAKARAAGVDAVENGFTIPGFTLKLESKL